MRFIILTLFILFTLNAKTINFQEEKYIEAIGQTIYKKGKLDFQEDSTMLSYKDSSKILIEKNGELFVKDENNLKRIDSSKQLALKIVFLLIKAIQKDDFEILKEFFTVDSKESVWSLFPKESLKEYIQKVEFKKSNKLDFITVFMNNGDKTIIRESND